MSKVKQGVNDLASQFPELAEEWMAEKNGLSAAEVHSGAGKKGWFKCKVCGYERMQAVCDRTKQGVGCAACAGRVVVTGINDLASKRPDIAVEWSSKNDVSPDKVLWRASKEFWFICSDCGYERKQLLRSRTVGKSGCSACSGHVFAPGHNDLLTVRPDIAVEWSPRNELGPNEVYWKEDKKYWFVCSTCGRERLQNLRNRVVDGSGCASCSQIKKVIKGKNDLLSRAPDVAAEWSPKNPVSPDTVLYTTHNKYWFICPSCGYEREQDVYRRVIEGQGCSACSGRVIVKGFNDLLSKRPDIAKEWSTKNALRPDEVLWRNNKTKYWLICQDCGYERLQLLRSRTEENMGCAACAGRVVVRGINDLATKRPDIASLWSSKNDVAPEEVLWRSNENFWFKCKDFNHESFQSLRDKVLKDSSCSICFGRTVLKGFNDLESKYPKIAEEWSSKNSLNPNEVYYRSQTKFWFKCKVCGYERKQDLYARVVQNKGCASCAGYEVNPEKNNLATLRPDLVKEWDFEKNIDSKGNPLDPSSFTKGSRYKAYWVCSNGHKWRTGVGDRIGLGSNCPQCYRERIRSLEEIELFEEISSWFPSGEVFSSWRGLGFEVDIWIPEKRVGVEFNGLYWHSEEFIGKDKHQKKYLECKKEGITLLQVWEDDWIYRSEQVLLGLQRKLGVAKEERLNARDLTLFGLEDFEAKSFLNQWHIQGFTGGKLKLGLLDSSGNIRTAAVFKDKGKGVLSLERYASNGIVRGGLGKTLSWVLKKYPGIQIETFADHTWSDGGLYETLGFKKAYEIAPDYKYIVDNQRMHKFGYRLDRFKSDSNLVWVDGLSEQELASLNGLPRIWDAGKTKYILGGINA